MFELSPSAESLNKFIQMPIFVICFDMNLPSQLPEVSHFILLQTLISF